jgi:excisionase family DNA binding protein
MNAIAFIQGTRAKVVTTTLMPDIAKLLYSRQEAAYALGISVRSVDYLIANKKLLVRRLGGRVLIPVSEVRRASRRDFKPLDRRRMT